MKKVMGGMVALIVAMTVAAIAQGPNQPTGFGLPWVASVQSCGAFPGNLMTICPIADGTLATNSVTAPTTFAVRTGTGAKGDKGDKGDPGSPGAPGIGSPGPPGPVWKTCPFTIQAFAMDGKGGASGTMVIDPTKCQ